MDFVVIATFKPNAAQIQSSANHGGFPMPKLKQLITALAILLSTSAVAQSDNDVWACQWEAAGGLRLQNGQWNVLEFDPTVKSPFVLMSDGNMLLTKESVGKVLGTAYLYLVKCSQFHKNEIACTDGYASSLYFNPDTARGATSRLGGTALMMEAFKCAGG